MSPPRKPSSPPARPTLSRDYIAATALALIDTDGLRKFSMRRLGTALGFDPMAVYRYFRDQEELFDGVAAALFNEIEVDTLPWDDPWRGLIEEYCERLREVLLQHPHAVPVFATRPVRSNAAINTGVRMLERLRDAGFPPPQALRVLRSVRDLTVGHALGVATIKLGAATRSRKPAAGTPEYNLLAEAADDTAIDDHFTLGLMALLDGVEQLIPKTRGSRTTARPQRP